MKTPSVEGEITNSASRVGDGVEEAICDFSTVSRLVRARPSTSLIARATNPDMLLVSRKARTISSNASSRATSRRSRSASSAAISSAVAAPLVFASHASSESAADAAAGAKYGIGGGVITARGAGRGCCGVVGAARARSTHPM